MHTLVYLTVQVNLSVRLHRFFFEFKVVHSAAEWFRKHQCWNPFGDSAA